MDQFQTRGYPLNVMGAQKTKSSLGAHMVRKGFQWLGSDKKSMEKISTVGEIVRKQEHKTGKPENLPRL